MTKKFISSVARTPKGSTKSNLFLLTALAGFIISGCKPIDCCDRSVIKSNPPTVTIPEDGGDEDITITSPVDWKVIEWPEWVTVSPMSGSGSMEVTISAEKNNTGKTRSGKIVIVADNGDRLEIPVSQEGEPIVYIAGYQVIDGINVATVWANGVPQILPGSGTGSKAYSVFAAQDGTVYVAGVSDIKNAGGYWPTLWVDGTPQMLNDDPGYATSVYVTESGDVYVAWVNETGLPTPNVWKNGTSQVLDFNWEGGIANSVYVTEAGKVYVAGRDLNSMTFEYEAVLWVDGVKQVLPMFGTNNVDATATSVSVAKDGTVYVVGHQYKYTDPLFTGYLWKDGEPQILASCNNTAGYYTGCTKMTSVFVAENGKVYVTGHFEQYIIDWPVAHLWIDGVEQPHLSNLAISTANSVYVTKNGTIYVAGYDGDAGFENYATLWKNGGFQTRVSTEHFITLYAFNSVFVLE